jgi:hypothetical protein
MRKRGAGPDRSVPPTRAGQKATFPSQMMNRLEHWTAHPCHRCGKLSWAADNMPGKPTCQDCPPK